MGLLDNNKVRTIPATGLEGSGFKMLTSNENFDVWQWDGTSTSRNLHVTFRDMFVWVSTSGDALYMVKGKITDSATTVAVNSTNFPNIRQSGGNYPKIARVIACPCDFTYLNVNSYGNVSSQSGQKCRICVIFENGQIYHNYPSCQDNCDFYNTVWARSSSVRIEDLFTKFDESVVWDLPNRKSPSNDDSLIETGAYYKNPALPANCYEMHPAISQANGYGNTVGFPATNRVNSASKGLDIGLRARFWRTDMDNADANSFYYMGGYIADNLFTMVGTYRSNKGTNPCRTCMFGTQDGGRSWYCMYEFAGKDRLKVGSSYVSADGSVGITLAQSGNAGSGIYTIKRRTLIVPDATNKEPSALFEYGSTINASSIVGTSSSITVTTSSAHGLSNGDVVVVDFQSGQSANNRDFDWMVNESADTTSGGNGIMFKVNNVTSTSFVLTMYVWNPDSNLAVRHIHALNRCKDGVAISCGEQYPHGGWIIYDAIQAADAFSMYNVADSNKNNFVRLNSTADSFQRPLGVVVLQEDDKTYCLIGSDNEFTPMDDVDMPDGRTETFKHNSCGVWKCELSGIDSQKENGLVKLNAKQVAYGFQQMENAYVFTGQFGALAISYDGNAWTMFQLPQENRGMNISQFCGMTYDRKFSLNNILVQLKK